MGARVGIRAGRRPVVSRGRALNAALVAAGEPPLLTTYDLTRGTLCDRLFKFSTLEAGYDEVAACAWPSEATELADLEGATPIFREGSGHAVYRLKDGSYAHVSVGHGWASVELSGGSRSSVYGALAAFQALYPASYLSAAEDRVPVTFWTLGRMGPERRLRMIDSAPWSDVEANYPAETRDQVAALMDSFEPGKSGQLILWQGPPGTGKTWALRALASQWLPWAEFHYITDPDSFFVDDPSYMVDVLLAETYAAIDEAGDVYHENAKDGKWRVLILEDTGELLSANAKEKYGQGLSRLLNVVDGMIGQGLRVLCLVTTNDELGELNAAVRRPGRCASQIVFPAFPPAEASAWLGEEVDAPMTVAEMYERRGDAAEALIAAGEFEFNPDQPRDDHGRWTGDGGSSGGSSSSDSSSRYSADEQAVDAQVGKIAEGHALQTTYLGHGNWDVKTTQRLAPEEPAIPAGHLMFSSAPNYPSVWTASYPSTGARIGNYSTPNEALAAIADRAP